MQCNLKADTNSKPIRNAVPPQGLVVSVKKAMKANQWGQAVKAILQLSEYASDDVLSEIIPALAIAARDVCRVEKKDQEIFVYVKGHKAPEYSIQIGRAPLLWIRKKFDDYDGYYPFTSISIDAHKSRVNQVDSVDMFRFFMQYYLRNKLTVAQKEYHSEFERQREYPELRENKEKEHSRFSWALSMFLKNIFIPAEYLRQKYNIPEGVSIFKRPF